MGDEPNLLMPVPPEQSLFAEALRHDMPEARAAYLDAACGSDTALRRRLEALLRAAENSGGFLEQPPEGFSGEFDSASLVGELSEKAGDRIGRYKLLEKIGEGGCGVVYMAEQEEPVRRRVALKVIKLGMDTRSVVARFEAERQALALMDHPNIAKVFDGGATPTGRLYFVMELVRGVRITEFCDEARLSTEARLRLFVQVCQAIQHAHQKGIIHRDLKPSNILVTVNDGSPVPKVIDFGIAKATGQRLTDKTLFTQFHSFMGTPAYTSPEQAEMSSVDIDTRSDIYSLGVLLYELLTGRTPFDGDQLLRSGLDEMRRIIRDDQPPRPSNRLDTLGITEATALSAKRKASVPELAGDVRGDLDWIVMKCLEKDRARRYETANGIAADIQRHLNHEPVTARPPSGMYLLRKLAHRNRGALIAAVTVLVALLVAVLALATSNARIRLERDQKDHALLERGNALEAARSSEQRARDQLLISLQNQAQARRNSGQMGQRLESLAALTEAARIRPSPELRDNAIAAMAIPDVERGSVWQAWNPDTMALAYDSLHQRYARIGLDGLISIRTAPQDRELQRLESPRVPPDAAGMQFTFSPDGRFLIRLDENGELVVWRWESGKSVLKNAPANCSAVAFSPDGRRIAVGHDHWITCFDLSNGEASRRWQTRDRTCAIDFHPDSRRLAAGYDRSNVVSIYIADDGEHVADLPMGASSGTTVAWHPEGNLLATAGSDPRIQIWDVKAQRKVAVLEGHVQQVTSLVFHSGGDLLTSTSWDGVVRLWQPSPGRLLMRLPLSVCMGSSREGRWAGVISPSNLQAQLWGIVPSQEYHTFLNTFADGDCELYEGNISPDGTLLALATSDGVRLWDVAQGREVAWLRTGDTRAGLFLADGRELLTCGPVDGLRRWTLEGDPKSEAGLKAGPSHQILLPFAPARIAKDRSGRRLAVLGDYGGECMILDLVTELVQGPEMLHFNAGFVALSANGERLATSGWHSRDVKLWDGQSGKLIKELEVDLTAQVFFTPDNREMIIARSKEFTFHDLSSLEVSRRMSREIGLYPGHVAFTADGKLMALEMAPGLIHLKEITSGRTIAKLEGPHGEISTWMSFTPDGTQLVVAARYAGAIHRWDLRAIRARLKTMNLDWDWPEFSAPLPVETSLLKNGRPLRVQIVGTRPAAVTQASATNASPAKP
jgi:serine/threonine protein kinase/WD40 repeat protein